MVSTLALHCTCLYLSLWFMSPLTLVVEGGKKESPQDDVMDLLTNYNIMYTHPSYVWEINIVTLKDVGGKKNSQVFYTFGKY